MRPCAFSARTRTLNELLAAENTNPPNPRLLDRPTPRLPSPWNPTRPGLASAVLPSGAVVLKLNPGLARVWYVTPVIGSVVVPATTPGRPLRLHRTGLRTPISPP